MFVGIAIALAVLCVIWVVIDVSGFLFFNGYECDYKEFWNTTAIVTTGAGAIGYLWEYFV